MLIILLYTGVFANYILPSVIGLDSALPFRSPPCNMKSQYEDWSDDASTIVGPSQNSTNREAESMVRNMKKAFKGKDQAVIGVVRPEAMAHVEDGLKPALWKRLFGKSWSA
jgi:hypothetical protein